MGLSLTKGQRISLVKSADQSSGLSKIKMGLGWDPVKGGFFSSLFGGGDIDLDASCLMYSEAKELVDTVYFGQLRSKDGSIQHTGDNRTGEGDGDDESILVDLSQVPGSIKYLAFTINSFRGQTFDKIDNAFCRLVDTTNRDEEICRYTLAEKGSHTGVIMAIVYRHDGAWKLRAVGDPANGKTAKNIAQVVSGIL